jgi:hypothetical protein
MEQFVVSVSGTLLWCGLQQAVRFIQETKDEN